MKKIKNLALVVLSLCLVQLSFAEGKKVTALEAGKDFLDNNKKVAGVRVTSSGLQYITIKEGTGPSPTAADKVKVHYKGTLINGQEFDSSKKDSPITFGLKQVIPGWTEGLQLMKKGGKAKFFIPSNLAYGSQVVPAAVVIPADSTLIFEVELLDIVK